MKKYTAVFLAVSVLFSLTMQAVFAHYFIKTSDLNRFVYIRKKIEKNARLSLSPVDSYLDFKKSRSTAVLALPSCGENMTIIPGSFDFFIMHSDSSTAVFSVYPDAKSSRKHKSLYIKNIHSLEYDVSGGLFTFKCRINSAVYGRSFFNDKSMILLPSETEVF